MDADQGIGVGDQAVQLASQSRAGEELSTGRILTRPRRILNGGDAVCDFEQFALKLPGAAAMARTC